MPASRSLVARILLPVVLLAGLAFAGALLLSGRAARQIGEDYDRLAVTAEAAHVGAILELAASELTAARLADNPIVAEAKRATTLGAVRAYWSGTGLEGLVLDRDGEVLATTLPDATTAAVAAARRDGFFTVAIGAEGFRCASEPFPAWGWTVITVDRRAALGRVRPEVAFLGPALALGILALAAGVLVVLWRNLRTPVAQMVSDVVADREVRPVGLDELDRVGEAFNTAAARLRARTAELTAELERRRQAELALADREARIRLLLDSTAEGIFGVDVDGRCTFCNPAALRLLGYASQEELLGRNAHDAFHHGRADGSEYPREQCPILGTSRSGRPARVTDDAFWRKDGTRFPVEFWSYPMFEGETLRGAVVGFVDITERTTLEQQLRQSQKMEAVGRLAGGIAHDFNNMLMAIIGHASLAREALEDGSKARHDLDEALAAADKAAGLTRQILAFSRNRAISLSPVDLNDVVKGMGRLLARLVGEDVQVEYRLADEELVALADRAQLEQVLLNLWTNARDAMPAGGQLIVGTSAFACDAARAGELGLEAPGRVATLTVSDSGVGMDEPTRQRVFEPFFTTKELDKGTGLGLSIVYGIVSQHRGQVAVSSAPGKGTTFTIYLPLAAGARVRARPPASARPPGGTETVLLAEDNEVVRELTRKVLEGAGYRVLVARDGEEAVALHAAHAPEVALCLFDVVMPGLGGREALAAVRRRRADVAALFMSGYAPEEGGAGAPAVPLLAKPFTPVDLLRHVREVLDVAKA
jgi:PAS domain S-box-containing protein